MSDYVDLTRWMKAFVTFVYRTITNEDTFTGMVVKLMLIVVSQIGITSTTKAFKKIKIKIFVEQFLNWRRKIEDFGGQFVDEKIGSGTGIPPMSEGQGALS